MASNRKSAAKPGADDRVVYGVKLPMMDISVSADLLLNFIYAITCFLSIFMVIWILIMPASWRLDWNWLPGHAWHRTVLDQHFADETAHGERLGNVPPSLVGKYEGHVSIQILHTLAGAVWAGILPFQFHNGFRRRFPVYHRWMGRIFLVMSLSMSVGILLIVQRGLLFTEHEFGDISSSTMITRDAVLVLVLTLWFAVTAAMAWLSAKTRQFKAHRAWMIRHAATGLWVAIQRIILNLPHFKRPATRHQQRDGFAMAGNIGVVVALSLAEFAIHLLYQKENKSKRNH